MEYAEPIYARYLALEPNDPFYKQNALWHLDQIHAPAAWNAATGTSRVTVCIIDSGLDIKYGVPWHAACLAG